MQKVGKVSSKVDIDINTLPNDASIKVTTSIVPDTEAAAHSSWLPGMVITLTLLTPSTSKKQTCKMAPTSEAPPSPW